jgi:Fe/S biogenesis protein NfuA
MTATEATAATDAEPAGPAGPAGGADQIVTITPAALTVISELRDAEPDGEHLGLKVEIVDREGAEFRYDLYFETVTKVPISDVIRNHEGLKVIVPALDQDDLQGAVLDHELGQLVMRNPNRPKPLQLGTLDTTDETAQAIRAVIDDEVNPALAAHGGFITFMGHDDEGKAYVTMGGGCHGCSMSRMTMLEGVQTMIVDAVPGIEKVLDVTDHATGENPYFS